MSNKDQAKVLKVAILGNKILHKIMNTPIGKFIEYLYGFTFPIKRKSLCI